MEFRPCIDIHNGQVKQIVGGSLLDNKNQVNENFVSMQNAVYYANLYKENQISGGHIILLNPKQSEYYEKTKNQALAALKSYPNGLQVGGGITPENANEFLKAGATHIIVTSYVFVNGKIHLDRLEELAKQVGKEQLVLDLSCKKKDGKYYIVTNRWQTFTEQELNQEILEKLADYCDEFLIHAVDVEGKAEGIDKSLIKFLGKHGTRTITYAGGVHNFEDLKALKELGNDKVNVTIGSALDIFGGNMKWEEVLASIKA